MWLPPPPPIVFKICRGCSSGSTSWVLHAQDSSGQEPSSRSSQASTLGSSIHARRKKTKYRCPSFDRRKSADQSVSQLVSLPVSQLVTKFMVALLVVLLPAHPGTRQCPARMYKSRAVLNVMMTAFSHPTPDRLTQLSSLVPVVPCRVPAEV